MSRLEEIKKRCEQAKLDVVIYSGVLDEISSEPGKIRIFNPGPNPIFEDTLWLVSQLEKAIKVIKFYSTPACAQLDQDIEFHEPKPTNEPYEFPFGKKAREFLEQL